VAVKQATVAADADVLHLAGACYRSRLLVGTGTYRDLEQTRLAIESSGAEIVTVAVRRTNIGQYRDEPSLLDYLPPERYTLLPNTAGCFDADAAVRCCRLARSLLDGHNLVKLEVMGEDKRLLPDPIETLRAAEVLVREGFQVMVYTNDDPVMAQRLDQAGCVAVMPLAAPIGSGLGICNPHNIVAIVEAAGVPVLVDAGVGTASDATVAMELGCDGVLMNTAIAGARDPVRMAAAMRSAVRAGRDAFLAGRIPRRSLAQPSSPRAGLPGGCCRQTQRRRARRSPPLPRPRRAPTARDVGASPRHSAVRSSSWGNTTSSSSAVHRCT